METEDALRNIPDKSDRKGKKLAWEEKTNLIQIDWQVKD